MTAGVHHRVEGPDEAPVVVFASSLGTTHEMWDPQAAALAGEYRVLRYDHRGHGRSPVPPGPYTIDELAGDLLALLDDLGIERASLVGLSLGGAVAMHAALQAPERFERVALCCTAMKFGEPETWHERAAAVRAEGMPAVAAAVLERWVTPDAPAGLRERLEALLLATPPEGYAACCEALGRPRPPRPARRPGDAGAGRRRHRRPVDAAGAARGDRRRDPRLPAPALRGRATPAQPRVRRPVQPRADRLPARRRGHAHPPRGARRRARRRRDRAHDATSRPTSRT